jgi:hypothetical protein
MPKNSRLNTNICLRDGKLREQVWIFGRADGRRVCGPHNVLFYEKITVSTCIGVPLVSPFVYPGKLSNRSHVQMTRDQFWLTVPQAVVLEATRNIELAVGLSDEDPNCLVIKANQLIARSLVISLEDDADEERRPNAFTIFHEKKAHLARG